MTTPRVLSLFSGGGGGDEGFERAGFQTAAYCEIDPFAVSVLKYHNMFNDRPILGDVRAISGGRKMRDWMRERFYDVELVHSSSPCQDLSVAGKRAGLKGLRSSLFFRSVRIWKFLQCPHFLWENVPGALSSHKGEDFAQVLSALVGGPVLVPRVGKRAKWSSAGVVSGPDGTAAWRILDLQHFGPPQRRRRLFVFGARAGGVDPGEVLLEREGLLGDPPPRRSPRQGTATRARGGADARGDGTRYREPDTGTIDAFADAFGFNWQNGGGYKNSNDGLAITPNAIGPLDKSTIKAVVAFNSKQSGGDATSDGIAPTLLAMPHDKSHANGGGQMAVLSFDWQKGNDKENVRPSTMNAVEDATNTLGTTRVPAVAGTLSGSGAGTARPGNARNEAQLIVFDTTQVTHPENRSNPQPGDPRHPLAAGAHPPMVVESPEIDLEHARFTCARCRHRFGINDQPSEEVIFNVFGHASNSVICPKCFSDGLHDDAMEGDEWPPEDDPAPTLTGHQRQQVDGAMVPTMGRPRRLMPIECERLMGWPQDFTKYGINTKGVVYELSDAARYRICGNGLGAPVTHWIGLRLIAQLNSLTNEDL